MSSWASFFTSGGVVRPKRSSSTTRSLAAATRTRRAAALSWVRAGRPGPFRSGAGVLLVIVASWIHSAGLALPGGLRQIVRPFHGPASAFTTTVRPAPWCAQRDHLVGWLHVGGIGTPRRSPVRHYHFLA